MMGFLEEWMVVGDIVADEGHACRDIDACQPFQPVVAALTRTSAMPLSRLHNQNKLLPQLTLDGLRGFEATARLGSFTAAADALCLTQSAVSKQVRNMEEVLGRPLLVRKGRGVGLTRDGQQLYACVKAVLLQLSNTLDSIIQPGRTLIAITAPPSFSSLYLAPRLASYRQEAPTIDLRVDASEEPLSMERDGFDLAIRLTASDAAKQAWTHLLQERLCLVASPELAAQCTSPDELVHLPLLEFDHKTARFNGMSWRHWFDRLGLRMRRSQACHRFSQYEHLLRAAKDGMGLAIGRRPLIDTMLDRGELLPVLPELNLPGLSYYLIMSEQAQAERAMLGFVQWLMTQVRQVPTGLAVTP
jgi:DNA-binding transcriptional LysR family regulator